MSTYRQISSETTTLLMYYWLRGERKRWWTKIVHYFKGWVHCFSII